MSQGLPSVPSADQPLRTARISADMLAAANAPQMAPTCTQFTRMPRSPRVFAAPTVRFSSAALARL